MSYQPYLIADYKTGLDSDVAPWLLPQDAFQTIEDAYIRHGIIYKRNGISLFGTLSNRQVTGIFNFVTNTGEKEVLATDIGRLYRLNTVTGIFDPIDPGDVFTSLSSNYMWFTMFGVTGSVSQNTLFLSNNSDNMRTYTTGSPTTSSFIPQYGPTGNDVVAKTLMMFVLKNRLILLGPWEGSPSPGAATQKPQRARWSRANSPAATGNNWRSDIPGNGGFVDAPTGDFIIGAEHLQDYIIVFFSNSTWALQPTSDPALPFRWAKINNFRACDATFSIIGHDRYNIAFGKTGIYACDGVEVQRIDEKIDDFVFSEINAEEFNRIFSERNYALRRSWSLYPGINNTPGRNNKALIRTEEEGAWSIYNIEMSCLGPGESFTDFTLADFIAPDYDWNLDSPEVADAQIDDFYWQGKSNLFLGGDYEGNVYILEDTKDDDGADIGFNVVSAGWNPYKEKGMEAQLGYVDIYCVVDPLTTIKVNFFINDNITPYTSQNVRLIPERGFCADIQNVDLTNPCVITADNHGLATGKSIYISAVIGTLDINGGPYTITKINNNSFSLDGIDATAFDAYIEGGIVTEYDPQAFNRVWKRVYAGGIGYLHYVQIQASGTNQSIAIHSITPWFRQSGRRMIG